MYITPLSGMQYAQDQVQRSASRLASLPTSANQPQGDSVDLSAEMVALLEAKNSFAANAKALEVMDQITQSSLNIVD